MAITLQQVRAALDPEEPDYQEAAKLGPEALPHLEILVNSGDVMLASKATYLASLIQGPNSAKIVETAAHSDNPVVRVAAAAAAANLSATAAGGVLVDLVGDPDPGVRKVARASIPENPPAKLLKRLEALGDEEEPTSASGFQMEGRPAPTGLMPGESAAKQHGRESSTMPGEGPSGMASEQGRMPGERRRMPGE
jgi:hypothetical protein